MTTELSLQPLLFSKAQLRKQPADLTEVLQCNWGSVGHYQTSNSELGGSGDIIWHQAAPLKWAALFIQERPKIQTWAQLSYVKEERWPSRRMWFELKCQNAKPEMFLFNTQQEHTLSQVYQQIHGDKCPEQTCFTGFRELRIQPLYFQLKCLKRMFPLKHEDNRLIYPSLNVPTNESVTKGERDERSVIQLHDLTVDASLHGTREIARVKWSSSVESNDNICDNQTRCSAIIQALCESAAESPKMIWNCVSLWVAGILPESAPHVLNPRRYSRSWTRLRGDLQKHAKRIHSLTSRKEAKKFKSPAIIGCSFQRGRN